MSMVIPEQQKLASLMEWVNTVRHTSPLLDGEADTLLAALNDASDRSRAIDDAALGPATLGLYGHSHEGKNHLLRALVATPDGRVVVNPGDKSLDYLSQINPGHGPLPLAIRFEAWKPALFDGYPLKLRLFREADLVQILMNHYLTGDDVYLPDRQALLGQLEHLSGLCQPQPLPGIDAGEIMRVARYWQAQCPPKAPVIGDDIWQQLATLLPRLDLINRSQVWSLFWGGQPELTGHFLDLTDAIQRLGHADRVLAPQSLLIDNFSLPADGFLVQRPLSDEEDTDILVRPVEDNEPRSAVNVPLTLLRLLCAELVLPVPYLALNDVEIIDIPAYCAAEDRNITFTKQRFLLEWYRQRQQPDVLLICNAAPSRHAIPAVAHQLLQWVETTHPSGEETLPGLVWAITPHDHRFTHKTNLDDAIQPLLGKPGQRWGTLQAMDGHTMQRLIEWLRQALEETQRTARITALRASLDARLKQVFQRISQPAVIAENHARMQAEQTVRTLQRIASRHGELLDGLLPAALVQQLPETERPATSATPQTPFNLNIDLFADPDNTQATATAINESAAMAIHKAWVNHVLRWTQCAGNATQLGIAPQTLAQLGDILITTSYRLGLAERLEQVPQTASQLQTVLGNFLSWLGYDTVPEAARPESRVKPGQVIFAAAPVQNARLTKLGDQPTHAATQFVYDWLVALYNRAIENSGYQHPLDVKEHDREALRALLAS